MSDFNHILLDYVNFNNMGKLTQLQPNNTISLG